MNYNNHHRAGRIDFNQKMKKWNKAIKKAELDKERELDNMRKKKLDKRNK